MVLKKTQVRVIKKPLDKTNLIDNQAIFPRMPTMYLELIENKSKVKRDLVNEEFKPSIDIPETSPPVHVSDTDERFSEHTPVNNISFEDDVGDIDVQDKSDTWLKETEEDLYVPQNSVDLDDNIQTESQKPTSVESFKSNVSDYKLDQSTNSNNILVQDKSPVDKSHISSIKTSMSSNLSKRLIELLSDSKASKKVVSVKTPPKKNLTPVKSKPNTLINQPPSLSELEKKGVLKLKKEPVVVKNTSELKKTIKAESDDEEDKKRELLFKFELLKQSYKNSSVAIPEFTMYSDYTQMKTVYDTTVRHLSLNGSVEQYKTYLIGGFMACEFVFGNFLKLDMSGFTQQQIMSMHNYDKLLVELGEKSYVPDQTSKWSVEVRLLCMIFMNAGFFIISKFIMQKTGSNLMNVMNNFTSKNNNINTEPTKSQTTTSKRKMKGPEINLDDI
jgi:hypothetical protein